MGFRYHFVAISLLAAGPAWAEGHCIMGPNGTCLGNGGAQTVRLSQGISLPLSRNPASVPAPAPVIPPAPAIPKPVDVTSLAYAYPDTMKQVAAVSAASLAFLPGVGTSAGAAVQNWTNNQVNKADDYLTRASVLLSQGGPDGAVGERRAGLQAMLGNGSLSFSGAESTVGIRLLNPADRSQGAVFGVANGGSTSINGATFFGGQAPTGVTIRPTGYFVPLETSKGTQFFTGGPGNQQTTYEFGGKQYTMFFPPGATATQMQDAIKNAKAAQERGVDMDLMSRTLGPQNITDPTKALAASRSFAEGTVGAKDIEKATALLDGPMHEDGTRGEEAKAALEGLKAGMPMADFQKALEPYQPKPDAPAGGEDKKPTT